MPPYHMLRKTLASLTLMLASALGACAATPIMGSSEVGPERMAQFVLDVNPDFDPAIAYAFHDIAARYGIRGDIALCQAIIETGWFRFDGGTAVRAAQYNFGGIGVEKKGMTGNAFETLEQGVEAMIQHLYAYCSRRPLPEGAVLLDPRFRLVSRGCAPMWEDLSGRWAMNPRYADSILAVYERLCGHPLDTADPDDDTPSAPVCPPDSVAAPAPVVIPIEVFIPAGLE